MAELVGMLGTSGFLGMMIGAQLGDLLVGSQPLERWLVDRMFVVAGLLGVAAVPFAWMATRRCVAPASSGRTPGLEILRKYQPGFVLAVGVATGAALSLPQTFLRTYVADLDIPRISVFFTVVAMTAVTTRVVNRRLPDRVGLTTMIFAGIVLMAAAQLLYLLVRSEWQLVFPGLPYGMGQAILYPMIAAVGTSTFPIRYRGLGITLVLAAFDVGQLIGAPAAGGVLHVCELVGMPGYPTLFTTAAAMLVLVGAVYWWTLRRQAFPQPSLGVPVILRFPRTAAQRRSALSGVRPDRPAIPGRPATARSHAGSTRSTAAAPR
jgi:MFS family permease